MRQELLTYLKANVASTFKVSDELPWSTSGMSLYNKNFKCIYLDQEQEELVDLIPSIGGAVQNRIVRVNGYLTVDAKNAATQIDSVITTIRTATNSAQGLSDFYTKTFNLNTELADDKITYSFEYVYTKLN